MGASDDEDDYVFYGTPIDEEEESRTGQRRKQIKDPAVTRQLPLHKQEVTDDEGRRRFHGAFTGGYSAGYYNTVGSLEGWTPSTFKSSRETRTETRGQRVEDFLDEDELAEAATHSLQARSEYDTFASTAAERARAEAAAETSGRAFSFVPDELITPVADSMGIRLLQKMGWRQGKGIGSAAPPAGTSTKSGSRRRWGPEAGVGMENTPIYALAPKTDTHGLGHDPFKDAEEFRAVKQQREEGAGGAGHKRQLAQQGPGGAKRRRGVAFGTGALEETDTFGYMEDYVTPNEDGTGGKEDFAFEIASDDEEDASMPARGGRLDAAFMLPGKATPLSLQTAAQAAQKDMIPGFVLAEQPLTPKAFSPPRIPKDYQPRHVFAEDLVVPGLASQQQKQQQQPAARAEPPEDPELRRTIEAMAPFVARNGPAFEALATKLNAGNPAFGFLSGGRGAEYYRWRVQEAKQEARAAGGAKIGQRRAPLNADDRGTLLGEAQLASTSAAASAPDLAPAAAVGPDALTIADGDRQRLQESLAGSFMRASDQDMGFGGGSVGLRQPNQAPAPGGIIAAAAAPPAAAASRAAAAFLSSAEPKRPVRTVTEWRPEPLLCKRFNVPDPYKGRPAPAPDQASRFKSETLALPDTAEAARQLLLPGPPPLVPAPPALAAAAAPPEEDNRVLADAFLDSLAAEASPPTAAVPAALPPPPGLGSAPGLLRAGLPPPPGLPGRADTSAGGAQPVPYAEKPIDLFKAIFEDSEDEEESEEEEAAGLGQAQMELAAPTEPQFDATSGGSAAAAELPDLAKAREAALAAAGAKQNQKQDRGQGSTSASAPAPAAAPPAAGSSALPEGGRRGLAEALQLAQVVAAEQAARRLQANADLAARQESAAAAGKADGRQPDQAAAAVTVSNGNGVSEEQRAAIERALKSHKHSSKRKKERDKGKHKVKAKAKKSNAKKSKEKSNKKKSKDSRGEKKGDRAHSQTVSESVDSDDDILQDSD